MKLLFLYETVYPDFIGGIELRNHEVAAALCRRGHEVTLAGLCGSLSSAQPNPRILSLGERGGLYNESGKRSTRQAVRFAAKVARSLDVRPYDVIETANMPYIHLLPLAARCAAARRPLLVTWYEYWGAYWPGYVGRLRAPAYHAMERLTAQLGDAAAAISELTRGRLQAARRGGGRDPVHLVPCGIDVPRVRAAAGNRERAAGPPLIHAGRLLAHKRLDILLRAVALLAHHDADPGGGAPLLTVFGEGPDRARLERLAADLGIARRVLFRGHVKTSQEVWNEMGKARIAVQPSAREGFGLFPLEAMAAGLPVVHCESAESAVGELVRNGAEGIEVAADAGALAAALGGLLAPAGAVELRRLGRNAQERAAHYDWEEVARQIEEICAGLIARRRR
jgi:glycosyltransferase involved in cell wall biosynthesis